MKHFLLAAGLSSLFCLQPTIANASVSDSAERLADGIEKIQAGLRLGVIKKQTPIKYSTHCNEFVDSKAENKHHPLEYFDFIEDEVIEGFGTKVPLTVFAEQFKPVGYQLFVSSDVRGELISWKGGKKINVINEAAFDYGLSFVFWPEKQTLTIARSSGMGGLMRTHTPSPDDVCHPFFKVNEWQASAGDVVTDKVNQWALESGWLVNWGLSDSLVFIYQHSFEGDFIKVLQSVLSVLVTDGLISTGVELKVSLDEKEIWIY